MTEAEAKTKWCPMVVFMLGGGAVRNRDACYDSEGTHCIGSACMMWRWIDANKQPEECRNQFVDSEGRLTIQLTKQPVGYCGLAGKI